MNSGQGSLFALALSIPFILAIPPMVGWWIGSYLDKVFDIAPYAMFSFLALGIIAGAKEAYRIIKLIKNEIDNERD